MLSLLQNLKFALRMLARRPGLTVVVILTLALGIGANSAIFSVVNGVLLQPLPYPEPHQLALVHTQWEGFGQGSLSVPEYFDFVDQARLLDNLGLVSNHNFNISTDSGEPERVLGAAVTPSVFDTLRVDAAVGRTFVPEEGEKGQDQVALLSHGVWQRRFGGSETVVGRSLSLDGTSYTVVGVMPQGFAFPNPSIDLWVAQGLDRAAMGHRGGNRFHRILVRLQPEVDFASAQAEIDRLAARLREAYPENYPPGSGFGFLMEPLSERVVGPVRSSLLMLLAAVGLVLLIACANVANLLLAAASSRQREMATRAALGASRAQVLRQLLIESLVLSVAGGLAALGVAAVSLLWLRQLRPAGLPRIEEISLDATAIAFTFALSVITGVLFGLFPAIQAAGKNFYHSLRGGSRESDSARDHKLRDTLVVAEVALATMLLIGAGLLIRSYHQLQQVDPGFVAEDVTSTGLSLSRGRYAEAEPIIAFYQELHEELRALPGVESVGAISNPPFSGWQNDQNLGVDGYEPPAGRPEFVQKRMVTPGYFETLKIPILRGRAFDRTDRADSSLVVVVSQSLARKYWQDSEAVGRRLKLGGKDSEQPWMQVIGVAGDVHHDGLQANSTPMFYLPLAQHPRRAMTIMVRTADGLAGTRGMVQQRVLAIDNMQPVYDVQPMTAVVSESTAQPRLNLVLLGAFATMAMLLAAMGIYGVISYAVERRTREIGVRMALGAATSDVLFGVLGRGLQPILIGLGLGLASSLLTSHLMASFLFQVSVYDPVTFAFNSLVLLAVALSACWIPARRATRVDPMVALRCE